MKRDFDVMVIGSGPGGEGAAMKLSKEGKRVAMVERFPRVGGNCTHRGTIPSKMLRHAVQRLSQGADAQKVKYPDLLRLAQGVITRQVDLRQGFYDRNDVTLIHGKASFADANTLRIHTETGEESYTADHFIIATGARSYHPADIDFKHPRILDSDTILQLKDTPKVMTIYGAGVIGCEYATIFKRMGMKVNLINTRPTLLSFLDDEIIDALAYHLRENGVILRHNEEYERVEADDTGVRVFLKSNKVVNSDVLLWCQGRTGNSDGMGLAELGVGLDSKGNIKVNEFYQTAQPHIYAVGDITGPPSLASAAYDQGRYAATHAATGSSPILNIADIPTGIYTIPEISSIGKTEKELTELKVPYEVGHSHFRHLARAQITGIDVGMLKLLFHRETLEILGIHCFGNQASEIVHIGQAIMAQKGEANTLMYFVNTTFNYPTMAEAYRVAALNGLNRIR